MTAPRTAALTRALRPAPVALHLPVLAARTWQEYLDAHDGDAERAGKAARADVADRERQNSAARRFVDAYKPLIQHLKLPESPEDADAVSTQALTTVKGLQSAAGSSSDASKALEAAHAALKKLGIDPEKITEGVAAAEAKFARATKADELEREVTFGKAAAALKFDAAKLTRILRDEKGVPELRKVKVSVVKDGATTEEDRDVWGIPTLDAQGKETFTALAEHPDVKGFESALRIESAPATVDANAGMPVISTGGASTPPPAGATFKLDGGLNTGNI